jgi:hypothetical protein
MKHRCQHRYRFELQMKMSDRKDECFQGYHIVDRYAEDPALASEATTGTRVDIDQELSHNEPDSHNCTTITVITRRGTHRVSQQCISELGTKH